MDNEEAAVKLANKLISVRLPDEKEKPLGPIVGKLQKQKHKKPCRKYNTPSRYGFPRLPSPEMLIAKPLEITEEMTKEEVEEIKTKKERQRVDLGSGKVLLEDEKLKENMTMQEFKTKSTQLRRNMWSS